MESDSYQEKNTKDKKKENSKVYDVPTPKS